MSENFHDPEMTKLEATLKALDPRPAALDRDRLMFQAGQRSAARRGWLLPVLSAALASAATLLIVLLFYHPATRIEFVDAPQPPAPPSLTDADAGPPAGGDYIRLRNRILTAGVDALPPLPPDPSSGPSPQGVLKPHGLPRDEFDILGGSL